ncbi:MAG: LysM peptidoglycan-binding domain-containing protein [Ardenticatenaceae bacterium]|nr:LysM peptidoglycan-binding domain-containing protein [Ardenticatenaceae bacterium]
MNSKLFPILLVLSILGSTFASVPARSSLAAPQEQGQTIVYVVRYGDTLSGLAVRFQTTVAEIMRLNGLTNPNLIYVGQVLRIPVGSAHQPFIYIVRRGDTLSAIARRFGTTVAAIVAANRIPNPNLIYVGQRLLIPSGTPPSPPPPPSGACIHTVRRGESLSSIGRIYGVSPYAIARANGIRPPYIIYAGQKLRIPLASCPTVPTATSVPSTATPSGPTSTATSTPVSPPPATSTPIVTPTTGAYPPPATSTPTAVPVPPTATNTPPAPTATTGAYPPPATSTPPPAATDTPPPAATNTPPPAATNTPPPAATNTPPPAATNTPPPAATGTPYP